MIVLASSLSAQTAESNQTETGNNKPLTLTSFFENNPLFLIRYLGQIRLNLVLDMFDAEPKVSKQS